MIESFRFIAKSSKQHEIHKKVILNLTTGWGNIEIHGIEVVRISGDRYKTHYFENITFKFDMENP